MQRIIDRDALRQKISGKHKKSILIIILIIITAMGGFFTVEPTEMAGVRRLGQVITQIPLKPGLHFKIPFIDTVDKLQISIDTFKAEKLIVYSIDNQPVAISVGMTYRIPEQGVLKLLYEVGRAGSVDIDSNIRPVLNDRVMRIFAKENTTKISEMREKITEEIKNSVSKALEQLFKLEVIDLQISSVEYSKIFEASIEAAVKAKNDAIAAENTIKKIKYEGDQKVVAAKAEAEALVEKSEAEKKATILAAEGNAKAIELEGEAKAKALKMQGEAIQNAPGIIELTKAQRWDGILPKMTLGNSVPLLNFDSETLKHDQKK